MPDLLNRVRRHELESVRKLFPPGSSVVEIGGGSGFQASIISSWDCAVRSFDIAGRPKPDDSHYQVDDYDGIHLPLPDASADIVFSSNVLEHVRDLAGLLAETWRVMKPEGLAIHILPTPSWRFWSIVTHYPFVLLTALGIPAGFVDWSNSVARQERIRDRGVSHLLRRALWPGPHGEFPSAFSELAGFRAAHWTRALEKAGLVVERVVPSGIYYSGYGILAGLPLTARCRMARVLGSSTQIIVARKRADAGQRQQREAL